MISGRRMAHGSFATAMALAGTVALSILTGCGASASDPTADGPTPAGADAAAASKVTFTEVYDQVFQRACLNCHTGIIGQFEGLDMGTQATAYSNMVNKSSSSCGGAILVVPGHADSSLLYQKLTSPSCGSRMPQNAAPLPQASVDLVKAWIDEGAPND